MLSLLSPERAEPLRKRLLYREGTAGALADPLVLALPDGITAGAALTRLKRLSRHVRYYLYVIDQEGRLLGVASLRELMLAQPSRLLSSVMNPQVERLVASDGPGDVLAHPAWRRVHALPVVDDQGVLLGIVGHETLRRLEQEASELGSSQATSFGLEFGDLCWIGMTKVLGSVATAVFRPPAGRGAENGGQP
jgi:magnesium transporter